MDKSAGFDADTQTSIYWKSVGVRIMKAILVFIDGTTCGLRHRIPLHGMAEFFADENIMKDAPTSGSVEYMRELAQNYQLVYIGARPSEYGRITAKWYKKAGFPDGGVYCGKNQTERMNIVKDLKKKYEFHAGIGDRWDDNELHLELGTKSFILQEWIPNWDAVRKYI
jgi:hypothetical protein